MNPAHPPVQAGEGQRDAVSPNLTSAATPHRRQRGEALDTGLSRLPDPFSSRVLVAAKDRLAMGMSLKAVAICAQVKPADLDLALWNSLGRQHAPA